LSPEEEVVECMLVEEQEEAVLAKQELITG